MDEKTKERFYEELAAQTSWALEQSGIQDSFCYRALNEARRLAEQLVDEKGQLRQHFTARHAPIYEAGYSDDAIRDHQQKFLGRWQSDAGFVQKFRRFSLPLCHPFAEEVVRWTLDLPPQTKLQDFHVKRAALIACLTPLRQSVGSCFATAPAIEIQQIHIDLFIEDLYELLSRGRLRRVVEGVEYAAPFCLSIGIGDLRKKIDPSRPFFASPGLIRAFESAEKISESASLIEKIRRSEKICHQFYRPGMRVEDLITAAAGKEACAFFKIVADNALLKIWEFTLAAYCDIKMEFSKWNLGWCIGLHPQEAGGIGAVLYQALDEKLHEAHAQVEKAYQDTVIAHEQLRAAETLASNARSQEELRRIKAEGIAKAHHLQACQDLYKEAQREEKAISQMLSFFVDQYTVLFQGYFQEIYDPEFSDETASHYEDRQAGFRLVYKHGRSDSSLWTSIHDPEQFISALDDFFRSAEIHLSHICKETYEKELVSHMTTVILQHIQTPEFIEKAMIRAKKKGRLPWAYSAGGSVEQIASLYYRKTSPLKSEQREVKDELDLFTFIIETMKGLPPLITNKFIKDKQQGLLLQSPTHVCLLLPGMPAFYEAWNDRGFTYTWIRDEWIAPAKQFYLDQTFSKDQQRELYRRLGVDGALRPSMTIEEFASELKNIPTDTLAAFLFQTLPLIPSEQCQALLQSPNMRLPPFLTSEELFRLMYKFSDESSADVVRENMRELKLAPSVFLFADTNWPSGYFSFVINPITLKLEVWKTDRAGVQGAPLPLVKSWLGKETWSIFNSVWL
ncbi:MAG: hypothetical protein ABSA17_04695 [Rhabdochlamydiaceae bacterium]|jgi:hypothetical protein